MYTYGRFQSFQGSFLFLFLAQIENSIAKEPKIQPTQLKQRSLSGNQEISKVPF
jgi:hypothetical protein